MDTNGEDVRESARSEYGAGAGRPDRTEFVMAGFLAPSIEPVYRFIAEEVGHRLARPIRFVVGSSFDQFEAGEVDAGFI